MKATRDLPFVTWRTLKHRIHITERREGFKRRTTPEHVQSTSGRRAVPVTEDVPVRVVMEHKLDSGYAIRRECRGNDAMSSGTERETTMSEETVR